MYMCTKHCVCSIISKGICVLGSVAQLIDSLEEVEILSQAKKDDIDFLRRFLDNNKFQSLLEVNILDFLIYLNDYNVNE